MIGFRDNKPLNLPTDLIEKYGPLRPLDKGKYFEVYVGHLNGKEVAVKILNPRKALEGTTFEKTPENIKAHLSQWLWEYYFQEIGISHLALPQNLAMVETTYGGGPTVALVSELAIGNLHDLSLGKEIPGAEKESLIVQSVHDLLSFFQYLEANNVWLTDLNPRNVLVRADGSIFIGDLDSTTVLDQSLQEKLTALGVNPYRQAPITTYPYISEDLWRISDDKTFGDKSHQKDPGLKKALSNNTAVGLTIIFYQMFSSLSDSPKYQRLKEYLGRAVSPIPPHTYRGKNFTNLTDFTAQITSLLE